jgi:undecaprenyl-phosphate galactose phosphotransferase
MRKKILAFFLLLLSDIAVIFLSFFIAYFIRSDILPPLIPEYREINLLPFSIFFENGYFSLVWVLVFAYEKLYIKRYPFWEETKILLKSTTLASLFIIIIIFLTRSEEQFSRTVIISAWLISLFLFPASRFFIKWLMFKFNIWKKKLIVIGVHETSLHAVKNIKKNKTMGYEVVAMVDEIPEKIGKTYHGVKVFGPLERLKEITESFKSRDIMVATPNMSRKKLKELLTLCEQHSESMWLIPRSGDFITEGVNIEVLGDILTLNIKRNLMKPWNILFKTIYEKILTFILFIIFLPLLLIISLIIKLDSPGPVLYIQKRVGKDNKLFNLLKFRSMYLDNESRIEDYLNSHPAVRTEWEKYRKIRGEDPRITRAGKWLRKFSLDELPQLLNVLGGSMNLVGPRPYLPEEVKDKDPFIKSITRVKPGITGLWQVSGRSHVPFNERLNIDEYYIRNWSLWMDVVILFKSIPVFLSHKGAY